MEQATADERGYTQMTAVGAGFVPAWTNRLRPGGRDAVGHEHSATIPDKSSVFVVFEALL
ncbi:MAG: hypothetical protein JO170_20195 [Verrucomicrobia bacterium]|nr:hypothetical protein [Verrucomicrobiota bacterium]